ncbi:EX3L2 protein, partial [Brachypteracias leptosomus]|nr:EX3L2 protein [Brachypteracias leptosomus]
DAFDSIVLLLTSFTQKLRPLRPEPYQVGATPCPLAPPPLAPSPTPPVVPQVLVSELHRRVLLEYVRPLLQGRLVCTSAKMRARVGARLGDEARQLRELFSRL